MQKAPHLEFVHVLRGIAIFFVVLLHGDLFYIQDGVG